jgi:two-component system response regulator LytT
MRILIVEDEPIHARYLSHTLKEIPATAEAIVHTQKTLTAAECYLLDHPVDLLFLDLNVYDGDGFTLLQGFAGAQFATIVVSAHPERAIEAFECGVLDFLPKPITKARLLTAIERYEKHRYDSRHTLKFFSIFADGVLETLPLAEISHFEAADKQVIIHQNHGRKRTCTRKLGDVEKVLPPRFIRVHRSFIADTGQIKTLQAAGGGRYDLTMQSGVTIPVSRSVYASLKKNLMQS